MSLYELVVDEPYCFFTMELIDGVDFFKYVRPSQSLLDEARLRAVLGQLVEGVRVLHDATIAHRDLKPSNVLVDAAGRVVVLDFGLALSSTLSTTETEGRLSGTVAYMAPEQAAGHRGGAASDCYSIGVMLYQALTGQLPHTGSVYEVLVTKQSEDPASPLAGIRSAAGSRRRLHAPARPEPRRLSSLRRHQPAARWNAGGGPMAPAQGRRAARRAGAGD